MRPSLPLLALAAGALLVAPGCDNAAGAGGALAGSPQAAAPAGSDLAFGRVRDFRLVRQDGEPVGLADFAGRPWVLASFFTTCAGPCPAMAESMEQIHAELRGTGARLVSLSVDPTHDTPEALTAYAEGRVLDEDEWWFLTGEESEVYDLLRHSVFLPAGKAPLADPVEGEDPAVVEHWFTHDVRLCVIDQDGDVRGWYHHADERAELVARVRFLLGE